MTVSLKRNSNGSLRAIPKASEWYFYNADTPDESRLARDCACCVLTPDGLLTEALVDTGETKTVTGSGTAVFPGFDAQYWIASYLLPSVTWNWGGIGSCTWTYYPVGSTSLVPEGISVDGNGYNAKVCSLLQVTLGDETHENWKEFDTAPTGGTITAGCSFGARLFANIEEVPRMNASTMWGPRPRWTDEETKDAVDLRKYKSAALNYYYWDRDNSGGSVTITVFGGTNDEQTLTLAGAGVPKLVGVGSAALRNAMAGSTDEDAASLSMTFFGSQAIDPPASNTVYVDPPDNLRGAKAWTGEDGHSIYARGDGANTDFQTIYLDLTNIQPARTFTSDFQIVTPHILSYADSAFTLYNYPGPDPDGLGTYAVNTEYPVGTALAITVPTGTGNTWTGTGEAYGFSAGGRLNGPYVEVLSGAQDTIGDPAFGFIYNCTALDGGGSSGDNWRCPIRIPAAAASWVAARLKVNRTPTFPATPAWSAGAGTTINGTSVTGEGTLTISQLLTEAWMIEDYRYLVLRMAGTAPGQTATLTIGAKTWTFLVPENIGNVRIDLCNPTNASGYDVTTSRLEVRTTPGGWGWGVDGEVTLTLTSAAPFDIYSPTRFAATATAGQLFVGETLHRWLDAFKVGDIVLREGDEYLEDTITTYATRGILYLHDGRVVLDEEFGITADGFADDNPLTELPYKAYLALKLSDVIRAANLRQGNSSKAAVALLEDRKPARFFSRVGWDGTFFWTDKAEFFNNQVEAYHLRPTCAEIATATTDIYADYCVDRIQPGVGVSCTLGSVKWLGGGLHGITVVDGEAAQAAVAADTTTSDSDTVSREPDGYFEIPGDELLSSTPTKSGHAAYNIITGWDGSPSGTVVEGTLMRVSVRK